MVPKTQKKWLGHALQGNMGDIIAGTSGRESNDPVNLPKWELGLIKNYVNTKLRKANRRGPFGSS